VGLRSTRSHLVINPFVAHNTMHYLFYCRAFSVLSVHVACFRNKPEQVTVYLQIYLIYNLMCTHGRLIPEVRIFHGGLFCE
jgi:hypothetical protein